MNNILGKTNLAGKINIISMLSLSILGNIILYNENITLRKEKTYMYELCKNAINEQIRCINKIKTQK